ncbi:MAG: DJ-1/PfpI family protein, partial [Sulfurimonas sp.]|uniref:DJ-1/PfpI family protein n=1 Tax=Sulfurimonas sp. TaxID=2022749 RepID=UPI0035667038
MSKVLVPLANGFEEIEAINIIDVLRRAKIEVLVASLDENSAVKGAHGVTVLSDIQIKDVDVDNLDMIVLPGGWGGTLALCDDETVQNILKIMDKKGKNIGAIC